MPHPSGCGFFLSGSSKPLIMHWPDGRKFEIDKVLDVRMVLSLIGGGHGMRYKCRIRNKEVNLFHNDLDGKWYIEE
ncbi:hypothetical protein Salpa_2570 [Sporomusa sp. KB1]|nr:hypothetical protein Salpa_2570 [Sporomusa sp. KB1]